MNEHDINQNPIELMTELNWRKRYEAEKTQALARAMVVELADCPEFVQYLAKQIAKELDQSHIKVRSKSYQS